MDGQAKCRTAMTWTIMLLTPPQSPSISIFAMPSISVTPPAAAKSPAMSHATARAGSPSGPDVGRAADHGGFPHGMLTTYSETINKDLAQRRGTTQSDRERIMPGL